MEMSIGQLILTFTIIATWQLLLQPEVMADEKIAASRSSLSPNIPPPFIVPACYMIEHIF
jgi:hypothetical protein